MWTDLSGYITRSQIPDAVKVSLMVLLRTVSYVLWTAIGVAIIIDKSYFNYVVFFAMALMAVIFLGIIIVTVNVSRHPVTAPIKTVPTAAKTKKKTTKKEKNPSLGQRIKNLVAYSYSGIVGNIAFYIFCALLIILFLKVKGVVDISLEKMLGNFK